MLPIRFRWAWAEEKKDHLVLTGKNLLSAAGIPYDPRRPGRAWETLERNLEELWRIQGLGRWEWEEGTENTLSGLCRLYPAAWQLDCTLHGLKPLELPPGPSVLTGNELKAWRKAKGWTQTEAARQLGVSQNTISVAEAKKAGTISDALALKVWTLRGFFSLYRYLIRYLKTARPRRYRWPGCFEVRQGPHVFFFRLPRGAQK